MPSTAAIDDYQWLVGPDAAACLSDLAQSDRPVHTEAKRLRSEHSAARTSLLLELVELRRRAAPKFSHAGRMFFTRVALEQATDEATARYKAQRFTPFDSVNDVCCGIGGDLIALAGTAKVTGIERDRAVAVLATANLRSLHGGSHAIQVADASVESVANADAWHADPDRRSTGRRSTQIALHSPDAATLDALLRACPHAAIKLAPASQTSEQWRENAELEWISRRGECRQQVAWFGGLARRVGERSATRLGGNGELLGQFVACGRTPPLVAAEIGKYLYEPDPAVLAAGLTDDLAAERELGRVAPKIGYLTGDTGLEHPLLAGFQVAEVLPLRAKTIASCLAALCIGRLEIKTRGVKLDPSKLRRELKLRGDGAAALLVFPHAGRTLAVVAERMV